MNKIEFENSNCLKPCSGFFVTSFSKSEQNRKLEELFPIFGNYNIYKKITQYPSGYTGKNNKSNIQFIYLDQLVYPIIDYEWKNKLRFVRIYFDTPTFNRITKDRAAKFVDMLSAIGGTMGLLTGFSIISGVEIIYFTWKIIFNILKAKKL